jgi:signal transduction histidine kinase
MAAKFPSNFEYRALSPLLASVGDVPVLLADLRKIACDAVELLKLTDCAIALLDVHGEKLLIVATSQDALDEGLAQIIPFVLHQSPLAPIITERMPLLLPGVHFDGHLPLLENNALSDLICLPILENEQLQGILIANSTTSNPLDSQQMRLLTLLADQAALVISKARLTKLAQTAERAKANFLSLLTHELRSPLNSINGYLDLILDGLAGELSTQQQEFIRRARTGSEHLYTMLEDLLLVARADADQLRLKREPVILRDLISDAFEGLELVARDAQVTLGCEIPPDLPALSADVVRLQQVARNLLSNAIHFTHAGGRVTLAARLLPTQLEDHPKLVEISVRDTGLGIASQDHERIFERFFQIQPLGGRVSGQGLGLAVAKLIIELHGGSIRVESVPGAGSTFFFTISTL